MPTKTTAPRTADTAYTANRTMEWIIRGGMMVNGLTPETQNDTTKNKTLFQIDKPTAAIVGHIAYLANCAVTSIKTWGDNNRKSGLNEGNATALAKSAWELGKHLLDGEDTAMNKGMKERLQAILPSVIDDYFSDDDDDEVFTEDDPSTEDTFLEEPPKTLTEELLGGTTTEASVQIDTMVSTATIMAVLDGDKSDKVAMIKSAQMAFLGDSNLTGQNFFCFRNGRNKANGIPLVAQKHNLSVVADFVQKVAQHGGFNLAGLACWRGGRGNMDFASDLAKGQDAVLDLAIAYCTVAHEAGVVKFDHDLRKYISDDTITALFDRCIDPSADLTHEAATTNGWLLPYQRGTKQSNASTSFKNAVNDLFL